MKFVLWVALCIYFNLFVRADLFAQQSQDSIIGPLNQIFYSPVVEWVVILPEHWNIKVLEKKPSNSYPQVLFMLEKGQSEIICHVENYDSLVLGSWQKYLVSRNVDMYLEYSSPRSDSGLGMKCDSSSGREIYDGLVFDVFRIKAVLPGGGLIKQTSIRALRAGYVLNLGLTTDNEMDQATFKRMLNDSRFVPLADK